MARAGGICLAAVVLALGAGPAQAAVVDPSSVTRAVQVAPGAAKSLTLRCPVRTVALSAAATSLEAVDSVPGMNARTWTLRFRGGGSGGRAAAMLRCVGFDLPKRIRGAGLAIGTRWSQRINLLGHTSRHTDLRCPAGLIPTGWGIKRRGGGPGLAVAAAVPTAHGFSFALENPGNASAAAVVYARCLERTQRARNRQAHRFSTRVASFTAAGAAAQDHSCRPSEFSVATGLSVPTAAGVVLASAHPTGARGGHWTFRGAAGGSPITTKLLCLSLKTRFIRDR